MSPPTRRVVITAIAVLLVAGACGNAESGGSGGGGGDGATPTTAEDGGASERDTFVDSDQPGVSDDEITFDVVGTKANNPLGTCILDCYVDGIEAYFAYRNSEGGIYGRDLVIGDEVDDELGSNQAKTLEVISNDDAFGVFQATLVASGWGDLDANRVPTYAWGIHAAEIVDRPSIFPSLAIRCGNCNRPAITYSAREAGATRVAALGYGATENAKDCTNGIAASVEHYQEATGVEVAYVNDSLEYGLPNGLGPEVTAMEQAGVDFVAACVDLNGMKTIAQELDRQGLDVTLYHSNSYDQTFLSENAGLFDGDFVDVQFRPFEADAAGSSLDLFQEWMEETGAVVSELAMVGWINATMAFDGLLAAGPEFDRDTVIDVTNTFEDYTAGGLVVASDWSRAHTPYTREDPDTEGNACTALVRVEGEEFVTVAPPAEPWLCWDPAADGWAEPEPTNFE